MYFSSELEKNREVNTELIDFYFNFVDKYGVNVEVPIPVILNELNGIGAPSHYEAPKNKYVRELSVKHSEQRVSSLKSYFMFKYIKAVKEKTSIEIKLEEFSEMENSINKKALPESLELNVVVRKDEDQFLLYIGSNIGSSQAGKTFGRFSYMDAKYKDIIKDVQESLSTQTYVDKVELSYIPSYLRSANVTQTYSSYKKNVSLYTNSHDSKKEISLEDIAIGSTEEGLYLKDIVSGQLLDISTTHMLNQTQVSNFIRILSDISEYRKLKWMIFPWEVYYRDFTYVPEIKYKNVILSNEKWSLQELKISYLDGKIKDLDSFKDAFLQFKNTWDLPDEAYIKFADNRIPIDVTNDKDIQLIFKNIKKYPSVILENKERGKEPVQLNNCYYAGEAVIPFVSVLKNKKETPSSKYASSLAEVKYLPFDQWLFLKIYYQPDRHQELLSHIYYLLKEKINGLADEEVFYYIRYNDPAPHIRLRIKSKSSSRLVEIFNSIQSHVKTLLATNLVSTIDLDTYVPEINRYGGQELQKEAEKIFFADSMVSLQINENHNVEKFPNEIIGVLSLLKLLEDMGVQYAEQLDFLESNINGMSNDKKYFQEMKKSKVDYITLFDSYNNWEFFNSSEERADYFKLFSMRAAPLEKFIQKREIQTDKINDLSTIIGSFIHMSLNRLFPIDRNFEEKIYSYAYHILYANKFKFEKRSENCD